MNCHHHEFTGLGSSLPASNSHHNSNNNSGGEAMSEIVIAHDVNQAMTTSYTTSEVNTTTVEQQRQRQHNLAMAKAEAVTSRYSSMCGLDLQQLPVQRHRKSQKEQQQQQLLLQQQVMQQQQLQQQQQIQQMTNTSTGSGDSSRGGGGGSSRRSRRRSSTAEPDFLALNKSFRKSFSSIASGDLPPLEDEIVVLPIPMNHHHQQQQQLQQALPPPPPLQTDVTPYILTPIQQQQKHIADNYSEAQTNHDAPLKSPSPTYEYNITNHNTPVPTAYPTNENNFYQDLLRGQQEQVWKNSAPSRDSSNHHQHHTTPTNRMNQHEQSLLSTMTIEDQAKMLRDIQQQQQQQQQQSTPASGYSSPRHVPPQQDHGDNHHHHHTPNTCNSSRSPAIQEQEQLWRELSRQRVQQHQPQQHRQFSTPPMTTSPAATSAAPHRTPQEEQAQMWERIQQQHHRQTLFTSSPAHNIPVTQNHSHQFSTPAHNSMRSPFAPAPPNPYYASPTPVVARSPLEEQAYLMEEIQRNRVTTTAPMTPSPPTAGRRGPGSAGLSAVEEQARMLRALELQRIANARANSSPSTTEQPLLIVNQGGETGLSAVEEQARMLRALEIQRDANAVMAVDRSIVVVEQPLMANQRREAGLPAVEEQAQMLYALEARRNANAGIAANRHFFVVERPWVPNQGGETSLSVVGEQARMFGALEAQRNTTTHTFPEHPTGLSAVEEQARILHALEAQRNTNASMAAPALLPPHHAAIDRPHQQHQVAQSGSTATLVNPVDQQEERLRQIEREKELQILEMACKLSMEDSAPSLALSSLSEHRNDQNIVVEHGEGEQDNVEDSSLQHIMDLSRLEAEAHSKAQQEIDKALQVAMERSREELKVSTLVVAEMEANVVLAAGNTSHSTIEKQDQANYVGLRRSIAGLAFQSSDRSMEPAELSSNRNVHQTPLVQHHIKKWGFARYGRK